MLKFQFPGWAERHIPQDDYEWLRALIQRWSPRWRFGEADINRLKAAIGEAPRLRAALRYYRALPAMLFRAEAWETLLQPARVPVRQIYGVEDGAILAHMFQATEHLFSAGCETIAMERAGHFMHIEAADEFAERVFEFLRQT
jgi:pimeloyl-ACP methyl ester carboxylesterase